PGDGTISGADKSGLYPIIEYAVMRHVEWPPTTVAILIRAVNSKCYLYLSIIKFIFMPLKINTVEN
ncbi:hypothetical protein, partial [Yersinia enterocolitica]